jgi:hypothetical protein
MSRFAAAVNGWQNAEGLPSAFASARDAVDALLRDRGLRRTGPEIAALALARGAEASARIEAAGAVSAAEVAQAALTGLGEPDTLGRPRSDEGSDGVAAALHAFGRELVGADAPGLVVAALAHAELAALAPFATANGLVARAFERLLLVARGVDPASSLVPEAGYLALLDDYPAVLDAYATGGSVGAGRWLSFAAQAALAATSASPLADGAG